MWFVVASRIVAATAIFLAVPVYIRYLGVESVALINLFMTVQAVAVIIDLGMSPAITRNFAILDQFSFVALSQARGIFKKYLSKQILIGVVFAASTAFLMQLFLRREYTAPLDTEHHYFWLFVAALSVTLLVPINLCMSVVNALGRDKELAIFVLLHSLVRILLACGAAVFWSDLKIFFLVQLVTSLFFLILAIVTGLLLESKRRTKSNASSLFEGDVSFRRYTAGIAWIGVLISQADKLMMVSDGTSEVFAAYTLAAMLASLIAIFVGTVFPSIYAKYCSEPVKTPFDKRMLSQVLGDLERLMILIIPVSIFLMANARSVLFVWTNSVLLAQTAQLALIALLIGNVLNGATSVPYAYYLSIGKVAYPFYVNVMVLIGYYLLLASLKGLFTPFSLGLCWVVLNLVLCLSWVIALRGKATTDAARSFLCRGLLIPVVSGLTVAVTAYFVMKIWDSRMSAIFAIATSVVLVVAISVILYRTSLHHSRYRETQSNSTDLTLAMLPR